MGTSRTNAGSNLPDGGSYLDRTADTIIALIRDRLDPNRRPPVEHMSRRRPSLIPSEPDQCGRIDDRTFQLQARSGPCMRRHVSWTTGGVMKDEEAFRDFVTARLARLSAKGYAVQRPSREREEVAHGSLHRVHRRIAQVTKAAYQTGLLAAQYVRYDNGRTGKRVCVG